MRLTSRKGRLAFCVMLIILHCTQQRGQNISGADANQREPVPVSYFGLIVHRPSEQTWPQVSFKEWRLWDSHVTWWDIEPQKGRWSFTALDKDVALAQAHGVDIMLTLGQSPTWASLRPNDPPLWRHGGAAPPANEEDWKSYVQTVATRYRGKIHYYEVWNEPNLKESFTGTRDQLLILARDAYQIIHNTDPTATLVSPAVVGWYDVGYLQLYLHAGGGRPADATGYHFYTTPKDPEAAIEVIHQVQQVMQHENVYRPLWNTEYGYVSESKFEQVKPDNAKTRILREDEALAYVMRAMILNWANGVQRLYWYDWDSNRFGIGDNGGTTRKPAAYGYEEMRKWMLGARVLGCNADGQRNWSCELTRGSEHQWIVWNEDEGAQGAIPTNWGVRRFITLDPSGTEKQGTLRSDRAFHYSPIPTLLR